MVYKSSNCDIVKFVVLLMDGFGLTVYAWKLRSSILSNKLLVRLFISRFLFLWLLELVMLLF